MEPTDLDLLLPHKHTNLISKTTFLIRQPAFHSKYSCIAHSCQVCCSHVVTDGLPFPIPEQSPPRQINSRQCLLASTGLLLPDVPVQTIVHAQEPVV